MPSLDEHDVKSHHDAGNGDRDVQSRSNHCRFIENSPDPFLLGQEPLLETRDLLEVGARADEQESKHKEAVERIDVSHCGLISSAQLPRNV